MQLSVIIVNYNVKYFLEQCLCSVQKAVQGIETEILVVDNASTDGSRDYLQQKFPAVQFLWSDVNSGFARANNLALQQAKGTYVLFLNPDTVVAEDSFTNCISFFEQTPAAGAIGVRMIDGSGNFLPESKRAFPSSAASFYKLSGLNALFPRSKTFAQYSLGYLDEHQIHEVDVLSGAFMMVRKELLQITGGFDEDFFMYGEDIDLSYRITQTKLNGSACKNFYLGNTTIIHFKGESTQKHSAKYVQQFYKAMLLFVKKHPQKFYNGVFNLFIQLAIAGRGLLSWFGQLFSYRTPQATVEQERLLIIADETTAASLEQKLPSFVYKGGFAEVPQKKAEADALLLCQTPTCSFKKMIAQTAQYGGSYAVYIHAQNSTSVVGSTSKNRSGVAVELKY